jgi:hypothetical protein
MQSQKFKTLCRSILFSFVILSQRAQADCFLKKEESLYCNKFSSWLDLSDVLNQVNFTGVNQVTLIPDEYLILTSQVLKAIQLNLKTTSYFNSLTIFRLAGIDVTKNSTHQEFASKSPC